ncbi:MAG: FAD-dependent oxidoreductase, partial [Candidatus Omnitrophota bacterium]
MLIKDNPAEFSSYLEDTSNLKGNAETLYIPDSQKELPEILASCRQKNIPITCCGGRTGTTGGCVPFGGAVVSFERLNRIINIDRDRKFATLEAGVPLQDLETALNKQGLSFPAQPTESLAFVGAAASTGASGLKGF